MITIRALVFFERLSGRSYQTIGAEEQDALLLPYAERCAGGTLKATFEEFVDSLNRSASLRQNIAKEWRRSMKYLSQFIGKEAGGGEKGESDVDLPTITDLALSLIAHGINPDFVLDRMDIWLIEPLLKQIANKEQEEQENKRLWAFINLSPYSSKGAKPTDLIIFPWEREKLQKEKELLSKQSTEDFNILIG